MFWGPLSALLSALHVNQVSIFSGLAKVPGDLIDGRLNNLFLEHVFCAWKGIYPIWSAGQFYPIKGTLAYSDAHLGTAFIYAVFRIIGLDIETSFQFWLITVCILNALSLYILLRDIGASPWICVPCVFFGTASSALIAQIGHPQIFPFFPFVLCFLFVLRAWRSLNLGYLIPAIFFYGYQHFCYLYYGYLCTWIFLFFGLAWAILVAPCLPWKEKIIPSLKIHSGAITLACIVTILALIYIYHPYYLFSRESGSRPIIELIHNAPRWSSWISASPFSLIYHKQNFLPPPTEINQGENYLFNGWIIVGLAVIAMVFLYRNKISRNQDSTWQVVACILFAWFAIVISFTSWSPLGHSPYLFLCERVPALQAFRAFSRIAYPLAVLQSVLAALLLQKLFSSPVRILRVLSGFVACHIFLDVLSSGPPGYSKEDAQNRALAILNQWQKLDALKPLLFVPGYTNQASGAVHLDAWSAALRNHGYTINGYSGNQPNIPEFSLFLNQPTPENGRRILTALKIPESSVAVVTTWTPSVMESGGIIETSVLPSVTPRAKIKTLTYARSKRFELPVTLYAQGDKLIMFTANNIFLSYRIYDDAGRAVDDPVTLRTRVSPLQPGQTIELNMFILTPHKPGRYSIHLSMVHEGVAWWEDKGWPGDIIEITVD